MPLQVIRTYKNGAGTTLRVDTIHWNATQNTSVVGINARTYRRVVQINKILNSGVADRDVAAIEIETDADTIGAPGNYTTVQWTRSNETIIGDMSDLPIITDTV